MFIMSKTPNHVNLLFVFMKLTGSNLNNTVILALFFLSFNVNMHSCLIILVVQFYLTLPHVHFYQPYKSMSTITCDTLQSTEESLSN